MERVGDRRDKLHRSCMECAQEAAHGGPAGGGSGDGGALPSSNSDVTAAAVAAQLAMSGGVSKLLEALSSMPQVRAFSASSRLFMQGVFDYLHCNQHSLPASSPRAHARLLGRFLGLLTETPLTHAFHVWLHAPRRICSSASAWISAQSRSRRLGRPPLTLTRTSMTLSRAARWDTDVHALEDGFRV